MKAFRYAMPLLLAGAWMLSQPAHAEERMPPLGHGAHAPGMPPMPLHALKLGDEQEDRIFAIMHAQEPAMRKLQRQAEKQREAMHAVVSAVPFDERKAAALAQEAGALHAESILQHARTHAQILAVLTPEQRRQLAEMRGPGPGHRRRGRE